MAIHNAITKQQVQEMYRLRKEGGYSNAEIAKHFGVAPLTVRRHIGCEGGTTHAKMPKDGNPTSNLKIVHQQLTIQGNRNVYQVNPIAWIMTFREIQYSKAEVLTMIAELTELAGMMEDKGGDEDEGNYMEDN